MKKSYLLLILFFLFSALLLSSCAPAALTADQVIQKMADNGKNLKTGQISLDMDMTLAGSTININSTGAFENPDKSFLTMNMMGATVQVLVLSPTEIYTRQGETGAWQKSNAGAESQTGSLYDFTKDPELLLKYYKNAKFLPDKQVAECTSACYHVSLELDVAQMFAASGITQSTLQNVIFPSPADVELWIGKSDFFVHHQESTFTMNINGQDVSVKVVVSQTGINQPVTIPTP
jgi:hypothetical protein